MSHRFTALQVNTIQVDQSIQSSSGLIAEGATSGTITLDAPSIVDTYNFTLPDNQGTNGYVLSTDGSGNTSWISSSASLTSDAQGNTIAGTGAGAAFDATNPISNTLFGYNAGTAITTGDYHTCFGREAGDAITTSTTSSVSIGYQAGKNASDTGVCVGYRAGYGSGAFAGNSSRVAIGYQSGGGGSTGATGAGITCLGQYAGYALTTGAHHICIGYQAGNAFTTGNYNIAIGYLSGGNTAAALTSCTFVGVQSGRNCQGNFNTFMGYIAGQAGASTTFTGTYNVGIGSGAMSHNTSKTNCTGNVVVGANAVQAITSGEYNTCVGYQTSGALTSGSYNVNIGYLSGATLATGSNNVIIGKNADVDSSTAANRIVLGAGATGTADNEMVIGNNASSITSVVPGTTSTGANGCYLGTSSLKWREVFAAAGSINTSDRNLKKNIEPLALGLNFINDLEPVKYQWKSDPSSEKQFHMGIIAQDVEEALQKFDYTDAKIIHKSKNSEGNTEYGFRMLELIGPMINAIKELSKQNQDLQTRVQKLEDEKNNPIFEI